MGDFKELLIHEGFEALDLSLKEQVENAISYSENIDDMIELLKAKRKKVSESIQEMEMRKERFKHYILTYMDQHSLEEINGVTQRFKASRSQPKLLVDTDKLADKFKRQVIGYEPDKELILKQLDLGFEVEGAKLEPTTQLRKYAVKITKEEKQK